MNKDFNDFLELMNSKDFSLVVNDISKQAEGKNPLEASMFANMKMTITLLNEYHKWLNS